jgi:transcriptional regulator with XRE-family HTH domain
LLSDLVGSQLERLRKQRGLTRAEVADRCSWLGMPEITPAALSNIETGRKDETGRRRRDITVDELVVLAMALQTVPATLLAPVGSSERVELIRGRPDDAWSAYRWLIGELPDDALGQPREADVRYQRNDDASAAIATYRRHEAALHAWLRERTKAKRDRSVPGPLPVLVGARIQIHHAGWWLPPIPAFVHTDLADALLAAGYRNEGGRLVELTLREADLSWQCGDGQAAIAEGTA